VRFRGATDTTLATHDITIRTFHEDLEQIRRALAADEFVLYYQPRVNMSSGKLMGAEALIRWNHPARGQLRPDLFLPVIENHPLIDRIGEWVVEHALLQLERWRRPLSRRERHMSP
jgi:EAL domain-containing protein (putative c-di-GMP-specific phosphodiesterase class I)